jgi:predicted porin
MRARNRTTAAIALAGLCAWSAAVQAQSSVTLYGLLDVAIGASQATGGTTLRGGGTRLASSSSGPRMDSGIGPGGSRFGLKGTEDLGNGLTASFVIESGFAVDTGASQQGGLLFGRQAFVALGSKAGWSVSAGRQYTPMNLAIASSDPTYGFYWGNPTTNSGFAIYESIGATPGSGSFGAMGRQDNSLLFTGILGGFTGRLMVGAGNENARKTGQMINPAVEYSSGALKLNASYARMRQNVEAINATADPQWLKEFVLGGSYNFGSFSLSSGYYGFDGAENQASLSPAATFGSPTASPFAYTWTKSRSYWIGGRVPVAGGTAMLTATSSRYDYATGDDGRSTALLAAYEYPLSKRTLLYTSVGKISNNAQVRSPLLATVTAVLPNGFGSNVRAYSFGVRHLF